MTIATSMVAAGAAEAQAPRPVPRVAPPAVYEISPPLGAYTDNILFGDVWRREQLKPRDRSIVTLATLIANGRAAQLRGHLGRALDNGVKPAEISEIIAHLAFYSGWPVAMSAIPEAKAVFDQRNIGAEALAPPAQPPLTLEPTAEARRRAAVQQSVGDVAPPLAAYTNDALFGDLWRRADLAPRDRSLVTVVALIANGQAEQMPFHVNRAMDAGLTEAELVEAVTHTAFYAGWPRAMSAVPVVKTILAARAQPAPVRADAPAGDPAGDLMIERRDDKPPVAGPASNFTGQVEVASRFKAEPSGRVGGGLVTFQPGARTNWHTHPQGQTLVVIAGQGWVQREGGAVREIGPGDVVWIPPGLRHWHGATAGSAMTHVAIAEAVDGTTTTWLEPVTDEQYRKDAAGSNG